MKSKHITTLCSLLLLTSACKTILQKDKYSDLNKLQSTQNKTLNTQKLKSSDHAINSLLIQNDSLNYWAWIQSSGFFHYHPETGFVGENGEIWISGNRNMQRMEKSNLLKSEIQSSDSSNKEHTSINEKNKTIEKSQTRKSGNKIWWFIGFLLLLLYFFRKHLKYLIK